jgi:hypothetical protein
LLGGTTEAREATRAARRDRKEQRALARAAERVANASKANALTVN